MRNFFIATCAVFALMLTGAVHAQSLTLGNGSLGAGLTLGGNVDLSGAANFAHSQQFGNASTFANTQSYGISESTFAGEYGSTGLNGVVLGSNHSLNGSVTTGSGSLSNATSSTVGNGTAFSATAGAGFGVGGSGGLSGAGSIGGAGLNFGN